MRKHPIKPFRKPDRLISYWAGQPWLCFAITVTGLLYNAGMLAFPYFEGRLIDTVVGQEPLSAVLSLLAVFLTAIVVTQLFRILKRYTVRRFANNAIAAMRLNVYNAAMRLSPGEVQSSDKGILLNRLTSDVAAAVEGMRKLTTEIFDTFFVFVFYVAYLFLFDVPMTLWALLPVALAILVAFLFRKAIFHAAGEARKASSRISGLTYDLFDNALTYRIYGRDEANLAHYDEALSDYEKKAVKASSLGDAMMPLALIIALIGLIPVVILGSGHVIAQDPLAADIPGFLSGSWTVGELSAYLSVFVVMSVKASESAKLFGSIENGLASWKRIKPHIAPYEPYPEPRPVKGEATLVANGYGISIAGKPLFSDLSFAAKKGEIIGVTGPIASGKSALGKSFLQLLPYEGSLCLFGKEIRSYDASEIAGTIDYLGHRTDLFTDTIAENVALGEPRSVLPFLTAVSFDEDLAAMPLREATVVGNEGIKLSGGQQERIALARTIYHRKDLVILDDPFASVDPATEQEIVARLREAFRGSLVILISHRLSSFPSLDQVIVLDGNGHAEVGTHAELLAKSPVYQNLYSLQSPSGEKRHD